MAAVGWRVVYNRGWLAGLIIAGVCSCTLPALAQPGGAAVVEVASVVQQTISQPVTFVGTAEPSRRSRVASEVEGIVDHLFVDEGQLVHPGDPLLQLRQESLRILLRARQATAERHRQELAELKNGTRPEVIAETAAEVAEGEAELARFRREMDRQMDLSERGVAAVRSREDAETDAKVAQQRLMRARKRHELALRGPRLEQIAQAEAQYQAAQAEAAALAYDLQYSEVKAPFLGFVVTKHTEIGQWLGRGDPVVTLIALSPAYITVPIPERYISHVQLGASGLVHFDALPDTTWQGGVIRIVPQATESRTFPVTIAIDNPALDIKSGFFARVTLQVGERQDALMVPKDAIVSQGPQHLVYVVREGKAVPVPVQRVAFHEGFAVVTGSLQPGEQVVIRGNERLRPGQPVQVARADR